MQTTLAVVEDELDSAEESVQDIQGALQEQLDLLHVVVQANAITLKTLMQQITQLKRYAHTH